jgi:hypothetical protein
MNVPILTPQQRQAGLLKAAAARKATGAVVADLKAGRLSLAAALGDDRAQRVRVAQLVRALPHVGQVKAARILEDAGIAESKRVAGLGPRQRAALIEAAGGAR